MDDDHDLRGFDNVCRLFALPRAVLLPHAVMKLHVFEPRYRQMTEDALAGDGLVTIVRWREPIPSPAVHEPPIEDVACLGRILHHERLPDGRFHVLLLGRKRVRLAREIHGDRPYRRAEAVILEDEDDPATAPADRDALIALFLRAARIRSGPALDDELSAMLRSPPPLGALTDLVAHAMDLPPSIKQQLLAEPRVARRSARLRQLLRDALGRVATPDPDADDLPFPPPFSAN